ncbi:rRNA maturation RNase YbeY [Candidatus Kaiserbacteria bacterium RIFCSPHIGHO2_02_FULL_49_11]|uniref:rRNA maturation RNase YbeY n=1 Tax=Candidatus Kaiserbacteria bacterium RIFCSPHIGHO2_02_FULL_49_11 TaxID=1798489 RepID=A0A1F6CZX3_9BACT|nr:MAG: rRNA maturation RNase YbeY [Candidatus Kaiserbacteria bacterium RIFCSPHIGHO2_02_FULL_49_11]
MAADNFSITKTTKGKLPRLPFAAIKDAVIGKSYNVSLVFIGDKRAQFLNRAYRRTSYIPNVLSFLLSKKEGEIFLNARQAKREAKRDSVSYRSYVGFLFIHGLLHLKGNSHGSTMDVLELQYRKRFSL